MNIFPVSSNRLWRTSCSGKFTENYFKTRAHDDESLNCDVVGGIISPRAVTLSIPSKKLHLVCSIGVKFVEL